MVTKRRKYSKRNIRNKKSRKSKKSKKRKSKKRKSKKRKRRKSKRRKSKRRKRKRRHRIVNKKRLDDGTIIVGDFDGDGKLMEIIDSPLHSHNNYKEVIRVLYEMNKGFFDFSGDKKLSDYISERSKYYYHENHKKIFRNTYFLQGHGGFPKRIDGNIKKVPAGCSLTFITPLNRYARGKSISERNILTNKDTRDVVLKYNCRPYEGETCFKYITTYEEGEYYVNMFHTFDEEHYIMDVETEEKVDHSFVERTSDVFKKYKGNLFVAACRGCAAKYMDNDFKQTLFIYEKLKNSIRDVMCYFNNNVDSKGCKSGDTYAKPIENGGRHIGPYASGYVFGKKYSDDDKNIIEDKVHFMVFHGLWYDHNKVIEKSKEFTTNQLADKSREIIDNIRDVNKVYDLRLAVGWGGEDSIGSILMTRFDNKKVRELLSQLFRERNLIITDNMIIQGLRTIFRNPELLPELDVFNIDLTREYRVYNNMTTPLILSMPYLNIKIIQSLIDRGADPAYVTTTNKSVYNTLKSLEEEYIEEEDNENLEKLEKIKEFFKDYNLKK